MYSSKHLVILRDEIATPSRTTIKALKIKCIKSIIIDNVGRQLDTLKNLLRK